MEVTTTSVTMTIDEVLDALREVDSYLWEQVVDAFADIALEAFQKKNGDDIYLESGILTDDNVICFKVDL